MCTVTILPLKPGVTRLVCNRDEQRSRALALPPRHYSVGGVDYLAPLDPDSGGTWIAVNQTGLLCVLLNRTPVIDSERTNNRRSRGSIIPSLQSANSIDTAIGAMRCLKTSVFAPFRLVMTDGYEIAELLNANNRLIVLQYPLVNPLMFTSSGLGDHLVDPLRRNLFQLMLDTKAFPEAQQNAFHRHRWVEHPELSVLMDRPDAATVSVTEVALTPQLATMTYQTCSQSQLFPVSLHTLELTNERASCLPFRQAS
ncbi:MAG TPA: NRDE family protein [Gemmatales bacterium]|nr:NRDE family protein [Gemmatales bacterium]